MTGKIRYQSSKFQLSDVVRSYVSVCVYGREWTRYDVDAKNRTLREVEIDPSTLPDAIREKAYNDRKQCYKQLELPHLPSE